MKRLNLLRSMKRKDNDSYANNPYEDFINRKFGRRLPNQWRDQIREKTNLPLPTVERLAKDMIK